MNAKAVTLPFDLRDELDVEWAGHPELVFPHQQVFDSLSESSVGAEDVVPRPAARACQQTTKIICSSRYIRSLAWASSSLPHRQTSMPFPQEQRHNYILQERHAVRAGDPNAARTHANGNPHDVVWPEGGELTPVLPLVRMGRGMMMGVDHNKNLEWVGGSAALFV